MAQLTHLYEPGMTYLITTNLEPRVPLFADPRYAQIAHGDTAFYAAKFQAISLSHVIMPEHIHWVLYPSPEDFDRFARQEQERNGKYARDPARFYLSKILEDYKRHTSYAINRLRGTRGKQVWQDGFRDDGLRTVQAIRDAVKYVVMNPVKAELVGEPEEYPFLAWDAEWLA